MPPSDTKNMARTKSDRARTRRNESEASDALWSRVVWLGLALGWVFLTASLLSFDRADPPSASAWPVNDPIQNWCGPAGAFLASWLLRFLGWGAWMVLILSGIALAQPLFGRRIAQPVVRSIGTVMLMASICGLVGLAMPRSGPTGHLPGGELGLVVSHELASRFGGVGASLWMLLLALVGLVVAFDRLVFAIPAAIWARFAPAAQTAGGRAVTGAGAGAAATVRAGGGLIGALATMLRDRAPVAIKVTDLEEEDVAEAEVNEVATRRAGKPKRTVKLEPRAEIDEDALDAVSVVTEDELEDEYEEDEYEEEDAADEEYEDEEDDDDLPGAPQVFSEDQLREKMAALPVRFASTSRKIATEDDLRDLQNEQALEGYKFPGLDLLVEPEENFTAKLESLVREQAEALESALREYKIDGEVAGIESGPVITQYDVRLAPGTKVAALNAVSSDVARALKAVNIRIVANQAGRDTVGVEVPNPTKEKVRLKELMSNRDDFAKMKLPMFLGKDASGEPLIADLTQMPHMLIAGTTGSGKSVCMNTIIMSFLYTKKPNELKLVLIDPKMVELSMFRDIPHLMCPVVTEMGKATAILEWAVGKMDERYELLAEAGVRDIAGYNELEWDELKERFDPQSEAEEARIPRKLPYIVFMIDELADLMMTNKEVEGSIVRIAQKARAVGMHLVVATQRPQANVVTGLIKSNLPGRIAFKVASGMDSRIVLDQKGAELLLGQGDMLFLSPRQHKLERCQGTLVEDREARKVVRFLKDVATPSFDRQLVQLRTGTEAAGAEAETQGLQNALEDPLFAKAVEVVLETKRGSVSLLQRRLAIGYTRASRLIDLMGEAGIIGEYKGTVAREVTITPETWAEIKSQLIDTGEAVDAGEPNPNDVMRVDEADEPFVAEDDVDETPLAAEPEGVDESDEEVAEGDEDEEEVVDETEDSSEESDEEEEDDEEYEYEYVDEDGNPIDPEDVDEEWDEEEEEWEEGEEEEEASADEPPFAPTKKA